MHVRAGEEELVQRLRRLARPLGPAAGHGLGADPVVQHQPQRGGAGGQERRVIGRGLRPGVIHISFAFKSRQLVS
jgi:hypothetical protein